MLLKGAGTFLASAIASAAAWIALSVTMRWVFGSAFHMVTSGDFMPSPTVDGVVGVKGRPPRAMHFTLDAGDPIDYLPFQ